MPATVVFVWINSFEYKEDNLRQEYPQFCLPYTFLFMFFFPIHFLSPHFHSYCISLFHYRFFFLPLFYLTPFSQCGSGWTLRWRVGESLCVSDVKWTGRVNHCVSSALIFISLFCEHDPFGSGIYATLLALMSLINFSLHGYILCKLLKGEGHWSCQLGW